MIRGSSQRLVGTLRRWIFGVLMLSLAGLGIELVLLEHYEDAWQWVPLVLIVVAIVILPWHRSYPGAASVRALRATMVLCLLTGMLGVALHFRGGAQFQLEIDRSMSARDLFKKVMRAKAPPVLAPGFMLQLGLLGLAYAYRYDETVS